MKTHTLLIVLGATLLTGCAYQTEPIGTADGFKPEHDDNPVRAVMRRQTEAGSRQDGTLYAMHFTDHHLNQLGEEKIAEMLCTREPNEPVTIWVSVMGDHDGMDWRRDAIHRYIAHCKSYTGKVEIKEGWNPQLDYPAAAGLAGLNKMEKSPDVPPPDQSQPTGAVSPWGGNGGNNGMATGSGPAPAPGQ